MEPFWKKLSSERYREELRVHLGGPVPSPVMAIHRCKSLGDIETQPGVYLTVQTSHLDRLVRQRERPCRLFVGHAGWGPGQLENELRRGDWLTTVATENYIFGEHDELWAHVVRQIGWSILHPALRGKSVPNDASWN
jgi:putative transcriptional regulator